MFVHGLLNACKVADNLIQKIHIVAKFFVAIC